MRATSVRLQLHRERPQISFLESCTLCLHEPLLLTSARPRVGNILRRAGLSKCCFQVRSCAVVTPERHHTLYRSELGYRTDFTEQYSLLEVIGKGNFGTVWLAALRQDPSHQVAVKVISKSRSDRSHAESLECIRREVTMWGCLSGESRYVAELLGLYEDGQNVYLVQQLCQGGDLLEALKEGPLPEACSAAIMWCVLSAIRDCHNHELALIDVKPQNFLLTSAATESVTAKGKGQDGAFTVRHLRLEDQVAPGTRGPCVVACDFGCSLSYTELMRGAKRAGSPVFFAPEQFSSHYGLVVDEWAAGVMLYLLLSGRYPFWNCKREELDKSLPAYQVMMAVCSSPITFNSPEWRSISRDARDLVSQLLDRNPATRLTADRALRHPWFARFMRASESIAPFAAAAAAVRKTGDALEAKPLPTRGKTSSEGTGKDKRMRQSCPQASTSVENAGVYGSVTVAAAAQQDKSALGINAPTLAACCVGSNVVSLLTPSHPPSAFTAAAMAQGPLLAGSDDEDSPGCSVEHYY